MIQLFKTIYSLLPRGDLLKLSLLIAMMVVASLVELLGVGLIPVFVAILAEPDRLLEMPELAAVWDFMGVDDFESLFFFGVYALAVIFVLKNIYIILYHYVEGRYIWNRYKYISGKLFHRYMNAPYTFHLNRNSSVILRNVTEEGRYLANKVIASMLKLCMNTLVLFGIFLLLMLVDPVTSLVVFGIVGGLGWLFIKLIRNKLSDIGDSANYARGDMIKSVNEGLGGLKDIRVLKREPWFVNRFLKQLRRYVNSQTFFTVFTHSNKPIIETIAVIGMLILAVALYLQGTGVESMITIMALFGAATVRMMPAMREIMRDVNNLRYYSYSVGPIYEDFHVLSSVGEEVIKRNRNASKEAQQTKEASAAPKEKDAPAAKDESSLEQTTNWRDRSGEPLRLKNEIRFEQVCFSYPGSRIEAVSDITFTIRKGDVVGITGTTGAGKTTIVDLMLGLLKPQKGRITFDGISLDRFLQRSRDPVGYIPQVIFLTDDTLERNIAFGVSDESIDPSKVKECIRLAQLTEVVENLPDGKKTMIGEHGVRLSGGQRQRIGIARALYHEPDILIMDEATSALDSFTEKEIVAAIEQLRGVRTIVMITHRITTLKHCDTIYFLENGKITDSGTLESLTDENSAFQKMSQLFNS